ncbi:peptidylprolyl isomerase [Clostridium sp.]|uniref:peptidylprolyl isomerase n=1 Tax=Clostridium sp. TaxID=1506 RepID=UPI003216A651
MDGEFENNGFDNNIKLDKWTIAMAGDGKKTASGSEFFITIGENEEKLNGRYAVFGEVINAFEVLERLEEVKTKEIESDMEGVIIREPIKSETITEIYVNTFDEIYSETIRLKGLME